MSLEKKAPPNTPDTWAGHMSSDQCLFFWIQTLLDDATELWGIRVARVEIKDVRIPVQLQRSMAAEAEATREARAKVRNTGLAWWRTRMELRGG